MGSPERHGTSRPDAPSQCDRSLETNPTFSPGESLHGNQSSVASDWASFWEPEPALTSREKLPGRIAIVGIVACSLAAPGTTSNVRVGLLAGVILCALVMAASFGHWLVKGEPARVKLIAIVPALLLFLVLLVAATCLSAVSALIQGQV